MGADLYIRSISTPAREKYTPLFEDACNKRNAAADPAEKDKFQKLVDEYYNAMYPDDGYFRDSYNVTSIMWLLGLSWWGDGHALIDDDGIMSPENCTILLNMLKERPVPELTAEYLSAKGAAIDDGENSVAGWRKFFEQKRESLMKFLQTAIDMKEGIECSV